MVKGDAAPRGEIVDEAGGTYELFPVPAEEETLLAIFKDCFEEWEHIHIGPLVPGAAWEVRPPRLPRITMLDGYATINFQDWHFHICIGKHTGATPKVAKLRQTSRPELYRRLNQQDKPTSWGLRLFNGGGDQQITFMLPNPFLTDDQQVRPEPDWGRLALWDRLHPKYLAIGPDPIDLTAPGFRRG